MIMIFHLPPILFKVCVTGQLLGLKSLFFLVFAIGLKKCSVKQIAVLNKGINFVILKIKTMTADQIKQFIKGGEWVSITPGFLNIPMAIHLNALLLIMLIQMAKCRW